MPCRRRLPAVVALVAVALMAACSSDEKPTQFCPPISILADAARLTRFADGASHDILDMTYKVEVADVFAGCAVKKGKDEHDLVTVGLSPVFVVTLGAANTDRQAPFQYFVSVVTSNREILTKQVFDLVPQFEPGRSRLVISEQKDPIAVDIPLGDGRRGADYTILLGLQLTEADLKYNLETAGRQGLP